MNKKIVNRLIRIVVMLILMALLLLVSLDCATASGKQNRSENEKAVIFKNGVECNSVISQQEGEMKLWLMHDDRTEEFSSNTHLLLVKSKGEDGKRDIAFAAPELTITPNRIIPGVKKSIFQINEEMFDKLVQGFNIFHVPAAISRPVPRPRQPRSRPRKPRSLVKKISTLPSSSLELLFSLEKTC